MIAAHAPIQRPADAKLLAIRASGAIEHGPRSRWVELLRRGDLVVANDAMTLPASLAGVHAPSGRPIEVRLAQRGSLDPQDVHWFLAIVFGEGDHRTRTEDRAPPPTLRVGDKLRLGPLSAAVVALRHPRLIEIEMQGDAGAIWSGLAAHGKPIQYAYLRGQLALWDVWTPFAATPAAFEPPSAGFAIDWHAIAQVRAAGAAFATITHAAGISSTGDAALDALLPFDEPYRIPPRTAELVARTRGQAGRVIAVGTTVVRALESATNEDGRLHAGSGIATRRIGADTRLRVVDAVLSGTHEPGTSHYDLLRAFAGARTLRKADRALEAHVYRTHEFGDSVFVERRAASAPRLRQQAHAARQTEASARGPSISRAHRRTS
jgi:S-adenosylmethionine:tRNA ribosyltransferase-isomerase